jgi:hypothetical protein
MMSKTKSNYTWQRYILVGAAIGLYFGFFFRPLRDAPSLGMVLGLSLLAALVTVGLKAYRERPSFPTLLRRFGISWLQFIVIVATLEGRHLAYETGGRTAVVLLTGMMGALLGGWWYYDGKNVGHET